MERLCLSGGDGGGLLGILHVNQAWRVTWRSTTQPIAAAAAACGDGNYSDDDFLNVFLFFYNFARF